jgi:hypothetical protein
MRASDLAFARATTTGLLAAFACAATGAALPERFVDPQDGQLDLSEFLASARGFLPIPLIVTEPAIGYGGGAAGMFLRPRTEAGTEGFARPDISAIAALGTQNGTWAGFAGDSSRWMNGRLKTLAGLGTGRVNLDFYGLAADRANFNEKVRYSLDFTGAVAQGNWQLAPRSPWSLGVRYVYANVEPKLRDEPIFAGLTDRVHVKVSGPTAILEYDSRDVVFTPTRGIYAETSYLASREALGSTTNFGRFQQVAMGWLPVADRVTLGLRGDFASASSQTPFFLRPYIDLRGVQVMRYQGDRVASTELELRWQFYGRWSVVGFAGAGTAHSDRDGLSVRQNTGSGGFGFRYELARKFGLHAGLDVAKSPGTTAVYFQVGNAWFRP